MDTRPDPDQLLARVQAEERRARGRLKIFFGASAGVGKTYAMLQAAHERRAEGVDLVAGYVETHGRAETAALLEGLELLPRRPVEYRGAVLEEFDLDAALARAPALLLVDELAHTNAPGARHPKRWQDVEELLAAGVDIYTTVNVQHIESLNDVVAQITGVLVRETVPDRLVELADEVELIDLTPDDLLQRLKEGKVYLPAQAERALRGFFRKGNLIALRELALRRTAERVDAQMRGYMREHAIPQTWPAAERILVCVDSELSGPRLVRAARRMAAGLRAEWIVVTVETPGHTRQPEAERDRIIPTLRLAEQLGAETAVLSGTKICQALLAYARTRNVTKIVVGKPAQPRWQGLLLGSTVDELVRHSGEIDVYVISGDRESEQAAAQRPPIEPTSDLRAYGWALLAVLACTALAWLMLSGFALANLIMVYLLGVVVVAARGGRGPAMLASLLSVAAFDFFFVPPYLTFAVSDVEYLVTFAVMLLVGLVISTLTVRLRRQADSAQARERRVAALYAMSREFARNRRVEDVLRASVQHIGQTFESQVVVLLPTRLGKLQPWGEVAGWWADDLSERAVFAPDTHEHGVAQWVFEHGQMAGQGTDTLAGAHALYLPLIGARGPIGVLGVRPAQPGRFLAPEQLRLLETFASQAALSLERVELADDAQRAQVRIETEQLRSSLLSSVSHDLRTPLAVITGALSSLADGAPSLDDAAREELIRTAGGEAERLNRLVGNLLDMTRVESGGIRARKEWQPIEEVVGAALSRLEDRLHGRDVAIDIAPDLPLVPLDSVLIEQVLINLLENALKYAPADSPLAIGASLADGAVVVEVADRGPGLTPGDEQRIFEKFYRAPASRGQPGAGLGLAIAKGMVAAHGGRIWAENRPGGAVFRFTLPLVGRPPDIVAELEARPPAPDRASVV
jgi:two-component system sensor histidine kinase KdpD